MGRTPIVMVDVDTPMLLKSVEWRRARATLGRSQNTTITPSTIHKDVVTLRQIFKYAIARGVITHIPLFPGAHLIGSIAANPQPWLTPEEYKRLLVVARKRIQQAENPRTRRQREELLAFIELMHGTGLRVDEARSLRAKDGRVELPPSPRRGRRPSGQGFTWILPDGTRERVTIDAVAHLRLSVTKSKTGPRNAIARHEAVPVFERLVKGKKPDDVLFAEDHRDAFRELLDAAGLRVNSFGHPRNRKCLRPTAISHWLLDRPNIDLAWLAANVGTSITMLHQFYLKRLGVPRETMDWL